MSTRARDRSLRHLHPYMRARVRATIEDLQRQGLPFRPFECFRTPERQRYLAARDRSGRRSPPWRSPHQYGLAADFALCEGGRWLSEKTDERASQWEQLRAIALKHGLVSSGRHDVHFQLPDVDMDKVWRGEYPEGGDCSWADNLRAAIARFPRGAPSRWP